MKIIPTRFARRHRRMLRDHLGGGVFASRTLGGTAARAGRDETAWIQTGNPVRLAILRRALAVKDRALRASIDRPQRFIEDAAAEMRRRAWQRRPALFDEGGLAPAVRSLIGGLPGRNGLRLRFIVRGDIGMLDGEKPTALHRVAHKAPLNFARHAVGGRRTGRGNTDCAGVPVGGESGVRARAP